MRLAREARGITLREISEQTRISVRYLEAIEANDYKRLPGGIFNRSFIKAYAKFIGYDEKEAVEGYTRTAREQGVAADEAVNTPYQPQVYTDGSSSRSPLVTLLLTILILAILSLGVYAALHWYQRRNQPSTDNNAPQSLAPGTKSPANASAVAPQANSATTPPSNSAATSGFNIQLTALSQDVWVRVYVDDAASNSRSVFAGNLRVGETKEFTPERSLRIQCAKDKPDALGLAINGRQAKVPFNMKGSLAEMTVTREDYEKFLQ